MTMGAGDRPRESAWLDHSRLDSRLPDRGPRGPALVQKLRTGLCPVKAVWREQAGAEVSPGGENGFPGLPNVGIPPPG
jgi:hypothetical protein